MGPQIPAMVPMEDIVMRENMAVAEDPLEFATLCLMIYGILLSVEFEAMRMRSLLSPTDSCRIPEDS